MISQYIYISSLSISVGLKRNIPESISANVWRYKSFNTIKGTRGKSFQHLQNYILIFQRDFWLTRTRFLISHLDFQRFLGSDLPLKKALKKKKNKMLRNPIQHINRDKPQNTFSPHPWRREYKRYSTRS